MVDSEVIEQVIGIRLFTVTNNKLWKDRKENECTGYKKLIDLLDA